MRCRWPFLILCIAVLACSVAAFADPELPKTGTYAVPKGWTEKAEADRVVLASTDGMANVNLSVLRDKRESWQITDEYLGNLKQNSTREIVVVSKDIYKRGDTEIARVKFTMQQKRGPKYRVSVMAIPQAGGGNLLLIAWAQESVFDRYVDDFNVVVNSMMPAQAKASAPEPFPFASEAVGLKLQVAAGWAVEPLATGKYSGAPYRDIRRDSGVLSISSNLDKHSPEEYVQFVEQNTREQSKAYEKISEKAQAIGGVQGTRLELLTTTRDGVKVRRVLLIFSRNDRHYVVAAGAPEAEFAKYAADFSLMMDSVALSE